MDHQGWTAAYNDSLLLGLAHGGGPALPVRTVPREDQHRERYEGRGMARTPRALANLKARLESQGQEVPPHVAEALGRAAQRDDRGAWQQALTQSWRDPGHIKRAEEHMKLYQENVADEQESKKPKR